MNEIESNPIYLSFVEWVNTHVGPDGDGKRKLSADQLWEFLDNNVFNDPTTVSVDGAQISLLWSYLIGPDQNPKKWDNNNLSADLADRANVPIRYIGNTQAGKFLEWLDDGGGQAFLGFKASDSVNVAEEENFPALTSEVLVRERIFNQFWHKLSQFYVENANGPLVTLTPKGSVTTIFTVDEIPALVDNSAINTINGVERADIGIDIFSSGSNAQLYYLLAVLNGEFAGDLIRAGTARVVRTGGDDSSTFRLDIDAATLAYLGLEGIQLRDVGTISDETVDADALRADLLPAFARSLHVALFGPVLRNQADAFIDFIGRDIRETALPDENGFKAAKDDFTAIQNALIGFVNEIWENNPQADISSLLNIIQQTPVRTDTLEDLLNLSDYFRLIVAHVRPYLDDAPEQLKRDLDWTTKQIGDAVLNAIQGIPEELQLRLAVTSGGRLLYLLDEQRDATLHPDENISGILEGVGTVSYSQTGLGDAFYLTLGASTGYALLRNVVELAADTATVVPLKVT